MLYYCPVCKKQENFDSLLELKRHIASLRNNGVPFAFPLICVDPLCGGEGSYSNLDSYIAHIRKYVHSNNCPTVVGTQNCIAPAEITPDLEVDNTDCRVNEFEDEVRHLLLSMYHNSTIPHVVVIEVVKSLEKCVQILKSNVTSVINN